MGKVYDYTNKRFGKLTVIEKVYINNKMKWKCVCDCGFEDCYFYSDQLNSGRKTMCKNCSRKKSDLKRRKSKIGNKYGLLTIKDEIYNYDSKHRKAFICDCDCGNKNIIKYNTYKWHSNSSCGCIKYKKQSNNVEDISGQKFGKLTVTEMLYDRKPIKVKCICECGNTTTVCRNDILTGHTQSCGCLQKIRASKARQRSYYNYVSDYGVKILAPHKRNSKNQMMWECECGFCGNHFYKLPAVIINNHVRSCGCLRTSSLEVNVENILKESDVKYSRQYSFKDCKNKYVLKFDFAIFDNSNNLKSLLEVDGEQHYHSVDYFGGDEGFEISKKRDNIKNKYCLDNNINLVRIPYYLTNTEIKNIILSIKKA